MEEKLHVAVDLDDVVLDFINGVRESFIKEFGVDGIPNFRGASWGDDVVAFTTNDLFKAAGHKNWWSWLRKRGHIWATFGAIDGSIGGIEIMRHSGCYVECVTSKPDWAEPNVWKWLARWRVPFQRVTIVTNGQSKLDYTDADVIIDDKLSTCEEFAADGRVGIFFDRSGEEEPLPVGVYRARNWPEVLVLVAAEQRGELE